MSCPLMLYGVSLCLFIFPVTCCQIDSPKGKRYSRSTPLSSAFGSFFPSVTQNVSLPQIFFFCFNFLKHIVSEKFSAVRKQRWGPLSSLSLFLVVRSPSSLWHISVDLSSLLRRKNSHFKDSDFTVEDLCQLSTSTCHLLWNVTAAPEP